jgi:acetyl-CoA carboxylase carboxyl transferase subunit alpha
LVDEVIAEPLGGAHRDPATAIQAVGGAVDIALKGLLAMDGATLRTRRREKFLEMGREIIG